MFSYQWGLGRFYAILVTKHWSSSDPDPKLKITDPNGSGSTTLPYPPYILSICNISVRPGAGRTLSLGSGPPTTGLLLLIPPLLLLLLEALLLLLLLLRTSPGLPANEEDFLTLCRLACCCSCSSWATLYLGAGRGRLGSPRGRMAR